MNLKILKQIIKEYWIAFISALAWSTLNVLHSSDWSTVNIINIFGPTFFLIVWYCDQYFRVRKQLKDEEKDKETQAKLNSLSQQLEEKEKNTINHLTGGNSFCYWIISTLTCGSNKGIEAVVHCGEHTLFNLQARIVDMDKMSLLESINDTINFEELQKCYFVRSYPNLTPMNAIMGESFNLGNGEQRSFNIFWTASNGNFQQLLRYKKIRDEWHIATKVMRGEILLYEKIDDNFPRNEEGSIDWHRAKLEQ